MQTITDLIVIAMLAGIGTMFLMIIGKLDVYHGAAMRRALALKADHGKTREVLDAVVEQLLQQEREEDARQKAAHDAIIRRIASKGA